MSKHYAPKFNQYEDLLSSVKTHLLSHKYTDERVVVIGDQQTGKTVFLKELIKYLRENEQAFCVCSGRNELARETFIPSQDKVFNPWSSQEFVLPIVDFKGYQSKVVPILNDFIHLIENDDNFNLFIDYPLSKDSEGNRFVLNSLINIALIKNSWLIFDEINFRDSLQNIGKSLSTRGKVAIAVNNKSLLEALHLHIWEQDLITINDGLAVLRITPIASN